MFLQIFLAYLFNQNALSEATTTYNYTIGKSFDVFIIQIFFLILTYVSYLTFLL